MASCRERHVGEQQSEHRAREHAAATPTVHGPDTAAGGCLAFFTPVTVGGRQLTAVGVLLGPEQGSDTQALLAAAGPAAQQLVDSIAPRTGASAIAAPGAAAGPRRRRWRPDRPPPPQN